MFPTSIFLSFFLGCGEEVDTGPQFKIVQSIFPLEIKKIVIFPSQDISTDSYLQCLPTISGADTATWKFLTHGKL